MVLRFKQPLYYDIYLYSNNGNEGSTSILSVLIDNGLLYMIHNVHLSDTISLPSRHSFEKTKLNQHITHG